MKRRRQWRFERGTAEVLRDARAEAPPTLLVPDPERGGYQERVLEQKPQIGYRKD